MFLQKFKLIFLKVQTNLQTLGVKTSTFMFSHLRANNGRCEKRCSSYFHTCAQTKEGVKNMFSHFCWNNGGFEKRSFSCFSHFCQNNRRWEKMRCLFVANSSWTCLWENDKMTVEQYQCYIGHINKVLLLITKSSLCIVMQSQIKI